MTHRLKIRGLSFKNAQNSQILPFFEFVKIRENSFLHILMNPVLNFDFTGFKCLNFGIDTL